MRTIVIVDGPVLLRGPDNLRDAQQRESGRAVDGLDLAHLVRRELLASCSDDSALVAAVVEAARLAVANASMQAAARERVAALAESRHRIVAATDAQRRQLGDEIHSGGDQRLAAIAEQLGEIRCDANGPTGELLDELERDLNSARADLDMLAQGLRGLRDRTEAIGGRLTVEARPTRGTRVQAIVPLSPTAMPPSHDNVMLRVPEDEPAGSIATI